MLNSIPSPASHVVAAELKGKVETEDVTELIAQVEARLEEHPRVSLLFDLSGMEGISPAAALNDVAYGLKNLGKMYRFQQVAVITDSEKLGKLVAWEDWLFKTVEIKSFRSTERDQAAHWVEKAVDVPPPGLSIDNRGDHLAVLVSGEITGHDVITIGSAIQKKYDETGPVSLVGYCDKMPAFGNGVVYEKLRKIKLLKLLSRVAVVGPEDLSTRVKAARALLSARVRHFLSKDKEQALEWLRDETPAVETLPTERVSCICLRISGRITSVEVKAFYEALLPHLKGDNSIDVLLEVPYEEGMTFTAVLHAVKLGIKHYSELTSGIRRVALITDSRFLSKATDLENLFSRGIEERPFTFAQRNIALAWLDEGRTEIGPHPTQALPSAEPTKLLDS